MKTLEWGVALGVGMVAVDGYEWREDLTYALMQEAPGPPDPGPWLVAQGTRRRQISLFRRRGLAEEFAELGRDVTPERIRTFANRWGMIGRLEMLKPLNEPGPGPVVYGESLWAWTQPALEFRDVWTLWNAVALLRENSDSQDRETGRAALTLLRRRITINEDGLAGYSTSQRAPEGAFWDNHHPIIAPDGRSWHARAAGAGSDPLVEAGAFDAGVRVNMHLGGMRARLLPLYDFVIRYAPETLEAAIWFSLALRMSGHQGEMPECPQCHVPFTKTRRNRVYCSPSCQAAARYRRVHGSPDPDLDRYLDR